MAMEEGITFAWDVGVRDVVFECDSKTVFGALNGSNEAPATIANVIYGIRHRFKNFCKVLVTHIKRQDNHPTHLLTSHTKNIGNYVIWIEENHSIIKSGLTQGVMFLFSS